MEGRTHTVLSWTMKVTPAQKLTKFVFSGADRESDSLVVILGAPAISATPVKAVAELGLVVLAVVSYHGYNKNIKRYLSGKSMCEV